MASKWISEEKKILLVVLRQCKLILIESGDSAETARNINRTVAQRQRRRVCLLVGDDYHCSASAGAGWSPSPPQIVLNHPHYI